MLEIPFLFLSPGRVVCSWTVRDSFLFFLVFFLWPWLRGSEEVEQALFASPLRNGIASCAGTHENSRDGFTTNRDRGVGFHESTM
ncbi:hypothetical protein T10_1539 [Trichinella papuae]|uniref:Uncharacterized protein n=1 Tax=Trichinella papuae TaxID=268474 RepID=A0A0V1MKV6_9BILA|nr:hypothetical protein T10_1539 [Trichinella papuae]